MLCICVLGRIRGIYNIDLFVHLGFVCKFGGEGTEGLGKKKERVNGRNRGRR